MIVDVVGTSEVRIIRAKACKTSAEQAVQASNSEAMPAMEEVLLEAATLTSTRTLIKTE